METKGKYYLGLDLGTASCGFAVTDTNYELIRAKGKEFWGVHEFETAESAAERRTNRGAKRRNKRAKARLGLVKSYFAEEIEKEDPIFFLRVENSGYLKEDKDSRIETKYVFFSDAEYTDVDFYKEYPTVFHLRKALLHDEVEFDSRYARKLYVAISSMFHHRGHFYSNIDSNNVSSVEETYESAMTTLANEYAIDFSKLTFTELLDVISDKSISRTKKKEKLMETLSVKKQDVRTVEFIKLIVGLKTSGNSLFELEQDEDISVEFSSFSYQEDSILIEEKLGTHYEIISALKEVYDFATIAGLLKGHSYLSEARCEMYEKHKSDLALLKRVYKTLVNEKAYNNMFRSNNEGTYSAYVNSVNASSAEAEEDKQRRNMKKRSTLDLYTTIKKDLKDLEGPEIEYIFNEIAKESFLPKQITGANGIIPNQVHAKELRKILENASTKLVFLNEKDDSGYTCKERIEKLFSFCIPYYIGPVGEKSKTGWAERKSSGRILPWNIEDKIDVEKTSEKFITNLIRKCTYLSDCEVLPKQSLLYEEYCVLNEINNIKINDCKIDVELKQRIFCELFEKRKKVTRKNVDEFIIANTDVTDASQITGIDCNINNSLSSFHKFYSIFGERLKEDRIRELCEEIIRYGAIYADSREMYRKKINEMLLSGQMTEDEAKKILALRFKDWGRLSKNFLHLKGCEKNSGEIVSVLDAMYNSNMNMMEIIHSNEYTFADELKKIEKEKIRDLATIEFEDLEEYYFPPSVKRMVWKAIKLIREIVEVMGTEPERLFIEMTREDGEKGKRTLSRERQLLKIYKENFDKNEYSLWEKEIEDLGASGKINSKKVYLYLLQMGKDAYTGKPIDLMDVLSGEQYDIDHIYPRHYVKDDNILNNLVLTNKKSNEEIKKDFYPIPDMITNNPEVRQLWKMLHDKGLMNDEKYHRLTSKVPFSDEQKAKFIARQLVETSQGTKGLADLLKELLPGTTIVYSKASNVSEFRNNNGFYKNRLVNDFHHAKDAYLNIVVGNVYFTKFTQNPMVFLNELKTDEKKYHYNLSKMFDWNVERDGNVAWIAPTKNDEGTLGIVRKTLNRNSPKITRASFEQTGAFYKVQPISHYEAKQDNYSPRKTGVLGDVTKYGGYKGMSPAFFTFIEVKKGNKRVKMFESVPMVYASRLDSSDALKQYYENELGYDDVRIINGKIRKHSLLKLNGYLLYIVGFDNRKNIELKNATPLMLDQEAIDYIRLLERASEKKKYEDASLERNVELYILLLNKHNSSILKKHPKALGEILENGKDKFEKLSIEDQIKVLLDIISYTSTDLHSVQFSLAKIGGPNDFGRIRISGNMSSANELLLLNESLTGMFETRFDLLGK